MTEKRNMVNFHQLLKLLLLLRASQRSEKLAEATRKYGNLKSELIEAQENEYRGKERFLQRPKILRKRDVPARKIQELKLAFSEFYLSLILLQNYQNLNFTGFRKILKKHDKVSVLGII
ncbi:hypothetical protein LSTR_LSTR017480 [Laodelphax striatellus]|uniref:SPX domain-containing protein n=1 Tax=Laodelphax striatellus TaxID=195883 RepID=A0A482X9Z7_LAOST|nr:hypothetical protein LSTR_LSTR017480 [Laodelphax striatellus]